MNGQVVATRTVGAVTSFEITNPAENDPSTALLNMKRHLVMTGSP